MTTSNTKSSFLSLAIVAVAYGVIVPSTFSHAAPALTYIGDYPHTNTHNIYNSHNTRALNIDNANAWLEVDAVAYGDNIEAMRHHLNGQAEICAILKADAYGFGINNLMPTVMQYNVPCIGISSNEEIRIARSHGYKGRIMRVRAATNAEIEDAMQYGVEELIGSLKQAEIANELAKKAGKNIKFHMALNAGGMDRNGIDLSVNRLQQDAIAITKMSNLDIVGIMTHFPEEDREDVLKGLKTFKQQTDWLVKAANLDRENLTIHAANSFVSLNVPEGWFDMVRPGAILFGEPYFEREDFKFVMSFKSRVASVNYYPKGSTVGYDRTYKLTRDSYLANLPFGYSDGYRRTFTNKGHVLINGHKVPAVGKISMNTTMVDVTDYPDIKSGDEVVIFGKQGNVEVTQNEVEEIVDTLFTEIYANWGNANPKFLKTPTATMP